MSRYDDRRPQGNDRRPPYRIVPSLNNIPPSQHSLFMRGFTNEVNESEIRDFFEREAGKCVTDFLKKTDDKLFLALRFDSKDVAKDVMERFNEHEVLGCRIGITWFKDVRRYASHVGIGNHHHPYNQRQMGDNSRGGRYVSRGRGMIQRPGGFHGGYYANRYYNNYDPVQRIRQRAREQSVMRDSGGRYRSTSGYQGGGYGGGGYRSMAGRGGAGGGGGAGRSRTRSSSGRSRSNAGSASRSPGSRSPGSSTRKRSGSPRSPSRSSTPTKKKDGWSGSAATDGRGGSTRLSSHRSRSGSTRVSLERKPSIDRHRMSSNASGGEGGSLNSQRRSFDAPPTAEQLARYAVATARAERKTGAIKRSRSSDAEDSEEEELGKENQVAKHEARVKTGKRSKKDHRSMSDTASLPDPMDIPLPPPSAAGEIPLPPPSGTSGAAGGSGRQRSSTSPLLITDALDEGDGTADDGSGAGSSKLSKLSTIVEKTSANSLKPVSKKEAKTLLDRFKKSMASKNKLPVSTVARNVVVSTSSANAFPDIPMPPVGTGSNLAGLGANKRGSASPHIYSGTQHSLNITTKSAQSTKSVVSSQRSPEKSGLGKYWKNPLEDDDDDEAEEDAPFSHSDKPKGAGGAGKKEKNKSLAQMESQLKSNAAELSPRKNRSIVNSEPLTSPGFAASPDKGLPRSRDRERGGDKSKDRERDRTISGGDGMASELSAIQNSTMAGAITGSRGSPPALEKKDPGLGALTGKKHKKHHKHKSRDRDESPGSGKHSASNGTFGNSAAGIANGVGPSASGIDGKTSGASRKRATETNAQTSANPQANADRSRNRELRLAKLPPDKLDALQEKRREVEQAYKQDCETFATVVKMLISKDPTLEDKLLGSLRESLKDIGQKFMAELNGYVDQLLDSAAANPANSIA